MAKDEGKRGEVVIRGYHPEMADIHTMNYDNNDPYLEARPKEQRLKYDGPKECKLEDRRPL